jgi:cbb3-type cytochrome oxidase subunit 3
MDINLLREIVTVASLGCFLGIVAYAVYPGNREKFERAAMMPLDDDDPLPNPLPRERGQTLDRFSRN